LQLIDLLKDTDLSTLSGAQDITIKGVTADSRLVKSGFLFAALPGVKADGTKFIHDAIDHGAAVLLVHEQYFNESGALDIEIPEHVQVIKTKNTRQDFAYITRNYYKKQPDYIVAVTGTSGKTSVASFTQQLWHLSGIEKCASLGTLGVSGPGIRRYGGLTTPDSEKLHAEMADLAAVGITHLAMEASSHGLYQYRLDGVKVRAGAYTNLSRDHLDYHKTMDAYFTAKSRLFSEVLVDGGSIVINSDDEYAPRLRDIAKARDLRVIDFGKKASNLKLKSHSARPSGQEIEVSAFGTDYTLTLPLVGEFQVMNALCALGLVLSEFDKPEDEIARLVPLIEKLRGVPGRLQLVEGSGAAKGAVYIDYAHKPAALETVLNTLRPHTDGRLVCVFGCGGDRDAGKRKIMGEIAGTHADIVVVTDDNPRSEDPAQIRAEIMQGCPEANEIGDRGEAIKWAISHLQEGDVLVVAGKGHEEGQIIGKTVLPFNDAEEVKKYI